MALEWRVKRKLFYFGIFSLFVLAIVGLLIFSLKPKPTCFDKKQNQKEEGIDCGGPCQPCVKETKEPIVLWTRFFRTNEEKIYDFAGLVKNQNYNLGVKNLNYQFRLYDGQNILIVMRQGKTFLNPSDEVLIFEPKIFVGERLPSRVSLELIPEKWEVVSTQSGDIKIKDKNFFGGANSRTEAILENQNVFPVENIEVQTALYDENGNAYEVSKTKISRIEGEESKIIVFSWPRVVNEPIRIEIYWQKAPEF